jgi:hypothetical protein
MFPGSFEAFPEKLFELKKYFAVSASKDFHIFKGKFERGRFQSDVPWRITEHEPKINVNNMTWSSTAHNTRLS